MTRRQLAIAGIGAILAIVLVGAAAQHQARVASSQEILVVSEAVDPRALLTGNYAVLSLQPREVETTQEFAARFQADAPAWLVLAPEGRGWRVARLGTKRPATLEAGEVAVRVRISGISGGDGPKYPHRIVFDWGVDRVYLDQDEALAVEKATRRLPDEGAGPRARVYAILAIDKDGVPLVKGVTLDGERIETSW